MSSENDRTIESYEQRSEEYLSGTVQTVEGLMKNWLDKAVDGLPMTAKILEIGSGFGRDAKYLQSKGYAVECSDATKSFLTVLQAEGLNARELNILNDEIGGRYDVILANAVLLHFKQDEFANVLKKVYSSLVEGGHFSFSVIEGEGEKWTDGKLGSPRYFKYWTQPEIQAALTGVGFSKVELLVTSKQADKSWIMITAYK